MQPYISCVAIFWVSTALPNLGDAVPQSDAEKKFGDAASWKFLKLSLVNF
jgi:hypothetical protein